MQITKIYTDGKEINLNDLKNYQILIDTMDTSNSATLGADDKYKGDAVDVAIKNYLKENNLKSVNATKITELPFDSKRKMMSAIYKKENQTYLYIKGSLESILQRSKSILYGIFERKRILGTLGYVCRTINAIYIRCSFTNISNK